MNLNLLSQTQARYKDAPCCGSNLSVVMTALWCFDPDCISLPMRDIVWYWFNCIVGILWCTYVYSLLCVCRLVSSHIIIHKEWEEIFGWRIQHFVPWLSLLLCKCEKNSLVNTAFRNLAVTPFVYEMTGHVVFGRDVWNHILLSDLRHWLWGNFYRFSGWSTFDVDPPSVSRKIT